MHKGAYKITFLNKQNCIALRANSCAKKSSEFRRIFLLMYLRLVADALFCVFIEEVNTFCIDSNCDNVAATGCGTGRYTSNKVNFAGAVDNDVLFLLFCFVDDNFVSNEVEKDFVTHKLCNFNVNVEG